MSIPIYLTSGNLKLHLYSSHDLRVHYYKSEYSINFLVKAKTPKSLIYILFEIQEAFTGLWKLQQFSYSTARTSVRSLIVIERF